MGEGKERHTLLGKYKNLEHEIDGTKEHLSEESAAKEDVYRQLNKAAQEADMWRQKFETECLAKSEDLEMAKMKLQARLTESEGTIGQMNLKLAQLEKAKQKLQAEITEVAAQKECRNASSELFRVKNAYEEAIFQLDEVRKE